MSFGGLIIFVGQAKFPKKTISAKLLGHECVTKIWYAKLLCWEIHEPNFGGTNKKEQEK